MLNWHELSRLASSLNGLPVLGCRPNSPAAQAGVRYGDIVLSVNGVPTPDWSAFIDAKAASRDEMVIELFRGGVTMTVRLGLPAREGPVDAAALLLELVAEQILPLPPVSGPREPEPN